MKRTCAVLLPAFVLAAITPNISQAQNGGYAVTERGANYRVLQKTTVEHGTNRVHQYTELATGLNYQNSYGQWTESKEEIDIQPNGGAAAVQGQHQVYFPADIYDGVLEVVTPDGRHLKSRPLGVSYDDGSSTVFIATLTNSTGVLTASNQVTYPNAFTDIKADLVCTYRKSGFECDLVFREKPPTPDAYGLDPDTSTLQLVTEFFNTQDPQQIPGASDEWFGLQDDTLKFGKLTMTHGKAFTVGNPNASSAAVYKRWLHLEGRTFLIEEVPLIYLADDLNTLPEAVNAQTSKVTGKLRMASNHLRLPHPHEFVSNTKQILIASTGLNQKPGVILDYDEIDSDTNNFTFQADTTYLIGGGLELDGTTTIEPGAVLKYVGYANITLGGPVDCETTPDNPAVLTAGDDNSVGESLNTNHPTGYYGVDAYIHTYVAPTLNNIRIKYAFSGFDLESDVTLLNVEFEHCYYGFYGSDGNTLKIDNALFHDLAFIFDEDYWQVIGSHWTADGCGQVSEGNYSTINLTNSLLADIAGSWGSFTVTTNHVVFLTSNAGVFQTAALASHYLATSSIYRNAGTTGIDSGVLTNIEAMTTYAPQDGGWPDTNAPDLGYHYPVNEDSDYDGLPDWWEWYWFGSYTNSGGDLDINGSTLLSDYENGVDPDQIGFTISLGNQHFNTTNATGSFVLLGGAPAYETVVVGTNLNSAVWTNYDGVTHLNLGPTDGVYQVWFGLKGFATNATPAWMGTAVYLDRVAPQLIISNPTNSTTAQPYLQVQGCAPESLLSVTYDMSNAVAVITNQPGQISGDQFFDTNTFEYTTNYFQCYDILLTNGLNTITVHATDLAGNVTTTNMNVTLDYTTATNPVIKLYWPQDNTAVVGTNFNWRGWTEDASAVVMAQITDTNGVTNVVQAVVERDGKFWVENLPLSSGTNWLTLWVTNAAGLSSATNIMVVQSALNLTVNPVSDDLWLPTVNVGGTLDDPDYTVWVNGVKSVNNGDGTWNAVHVPLPAGGTAVIQARAIPNSNNGGNGTGGGGGGPVSYDNLGNPDPPQDNDTEAGTADRPTEVVLDKAHWTIDSTENLLSEGAGNNDHETYHEEETYSAKGGGSVTGISEVTDTNGVTTTSTVTYTVAPDKTTTEIEMVDVSGWSDYAYVYGSDGTVVAINLVDSDGDDLDFTNISPLDNIGIPLELGELAWQSPITANYNWKKSSHVEYNLHIGGKAGAGQQVLVVVSDGGGTQETTTKWPYFFGMDPTSLTVAGLGKTLGSDGMAYGQSSVGATVSLNLTASVAYHSFGDEAGACQPYITARGNGNNYDLRTDTPEFCVGQLLTFEVDGLPTYVNSVQHWTLPGKYVNEQYQYSSVCTSYRLNTDLLANSVQQCWYVRDPGGTVSVGMDLQFANGQTVPIATQGNFKIYRPIIDHLTQPYSPDLCWSASAGADGDEGYVGVGGTYGVSGHDMEWDVFVDIDLFDYPSQLSYIQLIQDSYGYNHNDVPVASGTSGYWLDTSETFGGEYQHDIDDFTSDLSYSDGPGIAVKNPTSYVYESDNLLTYIRVTPPGDGSIPITLGYVEWGWNGEIDKSGGVWSLKSGSIITGPHLHPDDDTFPVWQYIYHPHGDL